MRLTYSSIKDWADKQYAMLDTKNALEAKIASRLTADGPITPDNVTTLVPLAEATSHAVLKDILSSDQRRDLHLTDAQQRTCHVEADYKDGEQAPYALNVTFHYPNKDVSHILREFSMLFPGTTHWIAGMMPQKPHSGHHVRDMDALLKENNTISAIKTGWVDAQKKDARLERSPGDGDIYMCGSMRTLQSVLEMPDVQYNRVVLLSTHGIVKRQYGNVNADLRAESPTPLIAACSVFDMFVNRNPKGVDGAPASAR